MDFSDRNAKLNKRLMESWGYNLNEKKTEKGFGEGTPPEGEWYDKKVIVMEDGGLDHPGMCCADAHGGQEHGDWATAQQRGRTEAPVISVVAEGEGEEGEDPALARAYGVGQPEGEEPDPEKDRMEIPAYKGKSDKLKEGDLPPWLEKHKKGKDGDSDESAEASSDDEGDIVEEPEEAPGAENERKKRDEPRNYVGRPGHVQNPLHEHEELVNRVVERVVARLQKS